jgi:hypothetical protein
MAGELRIALEGSLSLVRMEMCRPRELKALVEMRIDFHYTFLDLLKLTRPYQVLMMQAFYRNVQQYGYVRMLQDFERRTLSSFSSRNRQHLL